VNPNVKHYPYLELDKHGARLDTSSRDGFLLQLESGRQVGLLKYPPDPATFAHPLTEAGKIPEVSRVVQHSLNTLAHLDSTVYRMQGNRSFSEYGRKEKLAPVREQAVKTLGALDQDLRSYAKGLEEHKAQFYKVPAPAQNDVVGYFREAEIRNYLRSLSKADALRYMQGTDGEITNPAVLHAVLRSPVPNAALEEHATRLWRATRESEDPVLFELFRLSDASLEWGTSILKTSTGLISRTLLDTTPQELFGMAHPIGADELFGFTPTDIARYSRTPAQG
jgi:hypothetical protein